MSFYHPFFLFSLHTKCWFRWGGRHVLSQVNKWLKPTLVMSFLFTTLEVIKWKIYGQGNERLRKNFHFYHNGEKMDKLSFPCSFCLWNSYISSNVWVSLKLSKDIKESPSVGRIEFLNEPCNMPTSHWTVKSYNSAQYQVLCYPKLKAQWLMFFQSEWKIM